MNKEIKFILYFIYFIFTNLNTFTSVLVQWSDLSKNELDYTDNENIYPQSGFKKVKCKFNGKTAQEVRFLFRWK